jgi:hypothetical protein
MKEQNVFRPEDAGRLSEEEAQQEANMMRVKMGVVPETGKLEDERWSEEEQDLVDVGKETTAEDYDRVFEAIEEIKAEASEKMTLERFIDKLRDFPMLSTEIVDRLYLGMKGPVHDASGFYLDAESVLKSLKGNADRFGKREVKQFKKDEEARMAELRSKIEGGQ